MRRVVVTGASGISPIGSNWDETRAALQAGKSGVEPVPEWDQFIGLRTKLSGAVRDFAVPPNFERKQIRGMGRVALLATVAAEKALIESGLRDNPCLHDGSTGVGFGSCLGSSDSLMLIATQCAAREVRGIPASSYVQVMSHCCAASIAIFFKLQGRLIPTCSACTSASQAIGYSCEAIRAGTQKVMIAGGAEERCVALAAMFDSMLATSTSNTPPIKAPRPFDRCRDGLVVAEGAGALIVEDLDHALARGAPILAEIAGFATNCDGHHLTNPEPKTMEQVMRSAIADAGISAEMIGLVSAHATGTELGDIAESKATYAIFGDMPKITALKSYVGHTLGACGALESGATIRMMREGWCAPILHLQEPDERCAPLSFCRDAVQPLTTDYVMVNNFAFGGVNTSLIFKRWE